MIRIIPRIGVKCSVILLLLIVGCVNTQSISPKRISSIFQEEKDALDWISKKWKEENGLLIEGEIEKSENKMFVYSSWSEDSLFLYFKVIDSDLRAYQIEQDHSKLFLDDMIEVLLDPQHDKDSCWRADDIVYHINLHGVKKDDRGSQDCQSDPKWNGRGNINIELKGTLNDTLDIDKGYLLSLSLPWQELNLLPVDGLRMGINFANGDNDGNGRQLFDWVGAWPMRSPNAFGDLVLRASEKP